MFAFSLFSLLALTATHVHAHACNSLSFSTRELFS